MAVLVVMLHNGRIVVATLVLVKVGLLVVVIVTSSSSNNNSMPTSCGIISSNVAQWSYSSSDVGSISSIIVSNSRTTSGSNCD